MFKGVIYEVVVQTPRFHEDSNVEKWPTARKSVHKKKQSHEVL